MKSSNPNDDFIPYGEMDIVGRFERFMYWPGGPVTLLLLPGMTRGVSVEKPTQNGWVVIG